MDPDDPRWVEVTPSQFTHEAEGLRLIRELLPSIGPYRAWSNFEFRDAHGKWHEVDLLVLGRRRMHLVELKYYAGTLTGDDHRWRRDQRPTEDSPLKLARRKAQRLASKLQDSSSCTTPACVARCPPRAARTCSDWTATSGTWACPASPSGCWRRPPIATSCRRAATNS